jgi:ribosomal protein L14E/L6E/L27E
MGFEVGQVVISKTGRDKDRYMVVVKIETGYLYTADGKLRKLERPKRKNEKHLFSTDTLLDLSVITENKHLRDAIIARFGNDRR